MGVTVSDSGNCTTVGVSGRLDSNTSGEFERSIMALIDQGKKVLVVDCSGLEYVSSAGLRVFLMAAKRIRQVGGKVLLAALKPHVKEVFDIAGFTPIFQVYGSAAEAMAANA